MHEFTAFLFGLFAHYGYVAVFAGVLLANAGVPMAGELTLLVAGSMLATGHLDVAAIILAGAAAAVLSDSLWYAVGRMGSVRLIGLYCKASIGSTACVAKTEDTLMRFGPRSLILARFIPGFRTFAAPMAGMSGLAYRRFAAFTGIGALLWASLIVSAGWGFAHQLANLVGQIEHVRLAVLWLGGIGLVLFVLMKLWIRHLHGAAQLGSASHEESA
ncbi:MAG: DedA family protein [Thiobacillus sp.]|nr:DedA family protein [Thiobacillus sp.]MDP1925223.1 DedA family protein [Thiobacillus sp.]